MVLTGSEYRQLKKGDEAPDFSLPATNDKTYSLSELKGEKATLIVFMCNHCPYVIPKIKEIGRMAQDFKGKGLKVVCINPNEAENYPEDSFDKMKEYLDEWQIDIIYLRDESQEVAKSYGAVCTPDPFLFNGDLKLIYHGRIDDTHGEEEAKVHELYEAIGEFLATGKITKEEKPSMGCSIKWKNKSTKK